MSLTAKQKKVRNNPRRSALQKKVLLLLVGGFVLGLTHDPRRYFKVVKLMHKEWETINKQSLERAIRSLYESKLVTTKDNRDGTLTLVLSKEGKQVAISYNIENMGIKTPERWDKKWRIAMFDVPEGQKKTREALRMHFKHMGFYEFQKSVFVHPYPCAKEIEYLMEFYNARKYIRFILATEIDNALELKRHFNLK